MQSSLQMQKFRMYAIEKIAVLRKYDDVLQILEHKSVV